MALGLLLAATLPLCLTAWGQNIPTSVRREPSPVSSQPAIALDRAANMLTGPWKFAAGDSPRVNGSLVWAQPGFDDSHWAAMDLKPPAGSVDPNLNIRGYVPGWGAKGYPHLTRFAWYRLRLQVANAGNSLSLNMPADFDDAYQLYINGKLVGEYGNFGPGGVSVRFSLPQTFTVPGLDPSGDLVIAIRFYMNPSTAVGSSAAGGMHQPPVVALPMIAQLLYQSLSNAVLRTEIADLILLFLYLLAAPLALWAWIENRQERVWLWLLLVLMQQIASTSVLAACVLMGRPLWNYNFFYQVLFAPLGRPLWILFWWEWFGLRRLRWIPLAAWLLTLGRMLCNFAADSPSFGMSFLHQSWLAHFDTATGWFLGAQGVLLIVILVNAFRREVTDALLAGLPLSLLVLTNYPFPEIFRHFGVPYVFYPNGIQVDDAHIVQVLLIVAVGALALRHFLRTRVQAEIARHSLAQDLEQAQQLQQRVLVPETVPSPYFSLESEYRPAQTVGGDFFQMVAGADGSLLVVIGDVSGKGISAAMLVAVLIGTLCTEAQESFDPVTMLTTLNGRLVGRSMGYLATCLAAELRPDGTMRIANAGHLSPYLNGDEAGLDGALPLGSAPIIEPSVKTFQLEPGDVLTFITDGVVEAMNAERELFGFDRARSISRQPAVAIARQAAEFGQCDDITVLRIEFVGAAKETLAAATVQPASPPRVTGR
ncbi:MAG TPA: PP2C family protein-serine/threonine phosphatase [Acidobacteriaceae bacterium]|jgi:hypothetical protein|nr:PP2C family protein-serine/threonine phosphatase [Acidobacteriaceae bacterium]